MRSSAKISSPEQLTRAAGIEAQKSRITCRLVNVDVMIASEAGTLSLPEWKVKTHEAGAFDHFTIAYSA